MAGSRVHVVLVCGSASLDMQDPAWPARQVGPTPPEAPQPTHTPHPRTLAPLHHPPCTQVASSVQASGSSIRLKKKALKALNP